LCRHSSESWEAVGALARHVVLKAPDKADYRAVATEAAVALMSHLPVMNQHQFVLFAARLARTAKVCHLHPNFAISFNLPSLSTYICKL